MSALLTRAMSEVQKLPVEDQDALAAVILDEIDDERRWDVAFAKSPSKLAALAARAAEQAAAGQCRPGGFDEL